MTPEQLVEAKRQIIMIADAFYQTIAEAGEHGAPAGPMYAAGMQYGITLEHFEMIMSGLTRAGKIRKSNNCYFAVKGHNG